MEDFGEHIKKTITDLNDLSGDIKKMIAKKNKEEKSGVKENTSLRSLQPTIKMYGSKEDAKSAKENPEIDFVHSQLNKIFSS